MSEIPDACDIEIIEHIKDFDGDTSGGKGLIKPNDIRINGKSVLAPADKPVIIHEMQLQDNDCVQVTLTLFARRVRIRHEG